MPLVFRVMKKGDDNLPTVEQSAKGLGVRAGVDIDVDGNGNVVLNGKGMSVSPNWRVVSVLRIPRRLRYKVPGARGSNNTFCFRTGDGPFQREAFAAGLELAPDSATHGCIAPTQVVLLGDFENALAATRPTWQVDET